MEKQQHQQQCQGVWRSCISSSIKAYGEAAATVVSEYTEKHQQQHQSIWRSSITSIQNQDTVDWLIILQTPVCRGQGTKGAMLGRSES
jgi:hypothetical protein